MCNGICSIKGLSFGSKDYNKELKDLRDLPCVQQASCLEGGPLLWIWPLYLHVNQKSNDDELKTVECVRVFWARLACFGQLGLISDHQISSKLCNGINDPKGLENKIYNMMKGRETFYGDHTVPVISCSEVQYVL